MARPLNNMAEILEAFWLWVASGHCLILDRYGQLVPLVPNRLQQRMFKAWLKQARAAQPIRQIVLKSRKMGCSTFVEALFYFVAKTFENATCQTLAHTDPSTLEIFMIAQRMYTEDPAWAAKPRPPSTHALTFPEHGGMYTIRTAGGWFAGSGANYLFQHFSELAKYRGDAAKVQSDLMSAMNSVPFTPMTLIEIESTANMLDASMEFKHRWEKAEAGEGTFTPVFSPWFEEKTYWIEIEGGLGELDDEEIELQARYNLDAGQLAWRRAKIADDCHGEVLWFRQDFPTTPREAFQSPLGRVYGMLNKAQHARQRDGGQLLAEGWKVRRCVDWGGVDPFVCLWYAYNDRLPVEFTIDPAACPESWRELTEYVWGANNMPKDADNHGPDALRYGLTHFTCHGAVHVFRELYIPMAAARGETPLEHAAQIKAMSPEPVEVTVCDKASPTSITMFNNMKVPSIPYHYPEVIRERGEIVDGVKYLQGLFKGNHPLVPAARRPTTGERLKAAEAALEGAVPIGATAATNVVEAEAERAPAASGGFHGSGMDGYYQ